MRASEQGGFSGVAAGFQGDIDIGAARCPAGHLQGMHLGVRSSGLAVPSFADDDAILHDDASDCRIGSRAADTFTGQFQRPLHISRIHVDHFFSRS